MFEIPRREVIESQGEREEIEEKEVGREDHACGERARMGARSQRKMKNGKRKNAKRKTGKGATLRRAVRDGGDNGQQLRGVDGFGKVDLEAREKSAAAIFGSREGRQR